MKLHASNEGCSAGFDWSAGRCGLELEASHRPLSLARLKVGSWKEFIDEASQHKPLLAPFQKPTYSNVNFSLLGLALARTYNQTYEDAVEDLVLKPAGMTSTTFEKPDDKTGAIIDSPQDIGGESSWYWNEGAYNPTGGLFSTANDLARFSRHILKDTHLSNRWFKPASLTSAVGSYYGTPWEMFSSKSTLRCTLSE